MITNISPRFRVDAQKAPSSEAQIRDLEAFSTIPLPSDYVELIREGTEYEISIDNGKYIRIWGAVGCVEMNTAYDIQGQLGKSLAIGDDEGGSALIILPLSQGVRAGIYLIGFGCLDIEEGEFVAESLRDLLVNEDGIDVVG
jgi:hypothetical protein